MRTIYLLIFALFLGINLQGQYYQPKKEKKETKEDLASQSFMDRVHFGGNIGFEFGSYRSAIYVSPVALYDVSNNFKAGLGLNYVYISEEYNAMDYVTSVYGIKLLMFYFPFKNIMLTSELDYSYVDRNFVYIGQEETSYWQSAWFIGAGYGVPVGKKGSMYVSISYDVLHQTNRSYYSSPWRPSIGFYF